MPSFLTKVFARKRSDGKDTTRASKRSSDQSLLEGKFEAISPTVSPSATHFPELGDKGKEKDLPFALFRPKSRAQSPSPRPRKRDADIPHLTLNLPVPKEEQSRALGAAFEADTTGQSLSDHVIKERRLSPLETLLLVSACSKAITERGGLEALGVMHPHWHSASPDIQRKLISLYILSLAHKSPITTLSPTSDSPVSAFDSELKYTRSPHDIATALRWGLRHLKLEGDSFGESSSSDEWHWYNSFHEAERTASYPPNAFSITLVPMLPAAHANLLISTLDIISSIAAHAEVNGFSGSKLSKFLGLWLLTARRSADTDDWDSFYSRWESAGKIMEHLFLSWLRDEATKHQLPRRLLELVDHYPFSASSSAGDAFLPRSRFSTRQYDALFVRVETSFPSTVQVRSRQHPVRLINDALKSETAADLGEHLSTWGEVKKLAAGSDTDDKSSALALSQIFSDDTIGLLASVPADTESNHGSTLQLPSKAATPMRRRSTSLGSATNGRAIAMVALNGDTAPSAANGLSKSPPASPSSRPESPKNWDEFSTAGFGESNISRDFASTLLDKDVEVTSPRPLQKPNKKRRATSPLRKYSRSSLEMPSATRKSSLQQSNSSSPPTVITKSTHIALIQLDEAFVDFWSDALLDPVSSNWPKFVVCQLRKPLEAVGRKTVNWIVIEQLFTRLPAPPMRTPTHSSDGEKPSAVPLKRTISPRTPFAASSSLSAAVKRFSLFGGNQDAKDVGKRRAASDPKSPMIGELGEILSEEPEQEEVSAADKKDAAVAADAVPTPVSAAQQPVQESSEVSAVGVAPQLKQAVPSDALPATKEETSDKQSVVKVSELSPTEATAPPGEVPAVETTESTSPSDTVKPSPVPVSEFVVEVTTSTPVTAEEHTSSVSTESPVKDAPEIEAPVEPISEATVKTDVAGTHYMQDEDVSLPLAPEAVVQSGETPGPQLALDSTEEPVSTAEEVEVAPVDEAAAFEPPSSIPVSIEPLPREINVETSHGVDLEEVPIVPIGPPDNTGEVLNDSKEDNPMSDAVESAPAVERDAPVSVPSPSLQSPAPPADFETEVRDVEPTATPEHEDTPEDSDNLQTQVDGLPTSTDKPATTPIESDDVLVVEEPPVHVTAAVPDDSQSIEPVDVEPATAAEPEPAHKAESPLMAENGHLAAPEVEVALVEAEAPAPHTSDLAEDTPESSILPTPQPEEVANTPLATEPDESQT